MKSIKFNEFMSGEYKAKEKKSRKKKLNTAARLATSAAVPLISGGTIGTLGFISLTRTALASSQTPVIVDAVPATAKEYVGETTLSALAHVLDPLVDIMVALSFPIASVVIVGACFFFMFGNAEKAWGMIQNAGLGYVLIQVSPLIMEVLKKVGDAAI
jgi:nitrate reductase NapE component